VREVAAGLVQVLHRVTGWSLKADSAAGTGSNIVLRLNRGLIPELPDWQREEGYRLSVGARHVELSASSPHGLFNGVQTLAQLVAPADKNRWQVRACEVTDYPRFQWRGLLLDPARHFLPPDFLKNFIEVMACYKYNRLHLHLTDDQGWRIEIKISTPDGNRFDP
jgi:hexosaminidase